MVLGKPFMVKLVLNFIFLEAMVAPLIPKTTELISTAGGVEYGPELP